MNGNVLDDYCLNMNNSKVQELVNGTYVTNELSGNQFRFPPNFDITKLRGVCNPKFCPELYEGVSKNPADYGFGEPELTTYNVPEGVDPTEYMNACDAARKKEASGKRDSMNINQQLASMQQLNSPYVNSQEPAYNNTYAQPEMGSNGFIQSQQTNQVNNYGNDPYGQLATYYGYQPGENYAQPQQQTYANPYAYQQQPVYNQQMTYQQQNPQMYGYYNNQPQMQQYSNQMFVNQYQQQQATYNTNPQMGYYYQQPQQQYNNQIYSNPYAYQQQSYNYNPNMAQQISYANNNPQQMNNMGYYSQQQSQMQPQNNVPLNSKGKPKIQLYYSNGRCYNMDGSDGQFLMDELGMQINANPHAFDRKLLRAEHRNRERAFIDYIREKDPESVFIRSDYDDDYILVNPTPDPTKPGFEWDIVDQMRVMSEKSPVSSIASQQDITDDHYYNAMQQMYKEGLISFNRFSANANAGLEHINDNGYHAYAPNGFRAFGFGGNTVGYYNPYASQQQEMHDNHNKAMAKAFKVMQRGLGITDEEVKAADERAQKQATADYYKREFQRATEMQQNAFTNFIKQGKQSDAKDYISPEKYKYMKHYNSVFDARHKHVDPDMSFHDFMCNGGYADIYFADIKYQNKLKMDNLVRVYDDMFCRNGINQFAAFYDAFNATSPKGVTIKDGELHIEVPPEIAARHYSDRREEFFTRIFNRQNPAILPTDAEFFATQYSAPQFVAGLTKSQVTGNAVNPGSSGGWTTASQYGNQQYYQNPSGYMSM